MRALVTGAAGFIGSRLAAALARRDWAVTGVDSFSSYYDVGLKTANAQKLQSEYAFKVDRLDLSEERLVELTQNADVVFHLAAQPGVRASWANFTTYVRDNLTATQRLLDAAQSTGVKRFVFASSSSVYGQVTGTVREDAPTHPFSPYGVTKLAAEAMCGAYAENFDLPTVSLRLFTVYGPGQRPDMAFSRLIEAALTGTTFPVYGDGRQVRAFTYVDDVVDTFVRAGTADLPVGSVMNVSGGSVATLLDAIAAVESATGRPVRREHRPARAGDVRRTDADITRAREMLGWVPSTTLADGLRSQAEAARLNQERAEIAVS